MGSFSQIDEEGDLVLEAVWLVNLPHGSIQDSVINLSRLRVERKQLLIMAASTLPTLKQSLKK
jgi:hypothetical protein